METLEVGSNSMNYLLDPGDLIQLRRCGPEQLRLGDIIVFIHSDPLGPAAPLFVVHRLIWKRRAAQGWRLWTKADIAFGPDRRLPDSSVCGKVVAFRRGAGPWRGLETPLQKALHILVGVASSLLYRLNLEDRARRLLAGAYGLCFLVPGVPPHWRRALIAASLRLGEARSRYGYAS